MSEKSCKYRCEICNKNYKSNNSLWNHNNKFHINDNTKSPHSPQNSTKYPQNSTKLLEKNYNTKKLLCKFCNKLLSRSDSTSRHEKICKVKINEETLLIKMNNKIKELEKKINNKNDSKRINNTINNGTINNTTNNITIIEFGKENINKLPINEIKRLIRNDDYLYNIIKYINFNEKYPEHHSFCTTSLEGKYISLLNPKTNMIEKVSKNKFLEKVYETANEKIEAILFELDYNDDFRLKFEDKYISHLKSKYDNLINLYIKDNLKKKYKTNINELSYNQKDMIQQTWNKVDNIENNNFDDTYSSASDSTLASDDNSLISDDNTSVSIK